MVDVKAAVCCSLNTRIGSAIQQAPLTAVAGHAGRQPSCARCFARCIYYYFHFSSFLLFLFFSFFSSLGGTRKTRRLALPYAPSGAKYRTINRIFVCSPRNPDLFSAGRVYKPDSVLGGNMSTRVLTAMHMFLCSGGGGGGAVAQRDMKL